MDSTLAAAVITSVCTSASTAGVAITALILSNKRADRVEVRLDKIETTLEVLTGSMNDLDKRLGIIEDRIFNRP